MEMSFRSTIRSNIGNIKKLFLPKTGMQKKQVLQHPGYVKGVKRNKIIITQYIWLHLRSLFVMLEVSKALYTYMNRMKPLPQYVHTVASSLSYLK